MKRPWFYTIFVCLAAAIVGVAIYFCIPKHPKSQPQYSFVVTNEVQLEVGQRKELMFKVNPAKSVVSCKNYNPQYFNAQIIGNSVCIEALQEGEGILELTGKHGETEFSSKIKVKVQQVGTTDSPSKPENPDKPNDETNSDDTYPTTDKVYISKTIQCKLSDDKILLQGEIAYIMLNCEMEYASLKMYKVKDEQCQLMKFDGKLIELPYENFKLKIELIAIDGTRFENIYYVNIL